MLPIIGKENVAGPKVWKHAGIPAQGFESSVRVPLNKDEENNGILT